MKVDADPDFLEPFKLVWQQHRRYIMALVDELREAKSLDDLCNIEACPGSNDFYLYNKLCDVYFEHNVGESSVKILKFKFHLVTDALPDAPPLRQYFS